MLKLTRSHLSRRLALPIALSSLFVSGIVTADTYILKDGTQYNGSIVGTTDDSYILRVEVVKGIFEEKTVKKIDIKEVKKTDLSIAAFEKIKRATPAPDLLSIDGYNQRITPIKSFLAKFPKSDNAKAAKKMLETLQKEKALIMAGGVKINGSVISQGDIKEDKYNLEPEIMLYRMRKFAKASRYGLAMKELSKMEKEFSSTTPFRTGANEALAFLPKYKRLLDLSAENVEKHIKHRETALSTMSAADRERAKKIFESEANAYKAKLETAKNEEKTKWLPTNKYFEEPLRTVSKNIDREIIRLNRIVSTPLKQNAGSLYKELNTLLSEENYKSAREKLISFRRAKPNKADLKDFEDRVKALDKKLKERKIAEKNKAKEQTKKNSGGGALDKLEDKTGLKKKNDLLDKVKNK